MQATYLFGSMGQANCWWTGLEKDGTYDPVLGYGFVLTRPNGLPGVCIWAFVVGFAIHSPPRELTKEALHFFLNAAVKAGLLCNPNKCHPPSQVAKYCGFILDCQGIAQV